MAGLICGVIDSDGSKISGEGFTVNKYATGNYIVTFTSKFTQVPAVVTTTCTVSGSLSGLDVTSICTPTVESCSIWTHDANGGAADRPFAFIAAVSA